MILPEIELLDTLETLLPRLATQSVSRKYPESQLIVIPERVWG